MATTVHASSWSIEVNQERIDITSSLPSPNERWQFTDRQGHEHRYDRGYPTLDLVVDAEHWCNGDEGWGGHDPHMHVDACHYECSECREVIEPSMDPPFTPKTMPGMISATLTGIRSDGAEITTYLTLDELTVLRGELTDDAVLAFLDSVADDRIVSMSVSA